MKDFTNKFRRKIKNFYPTQSHTSTFSTMVQHSSQMDFFSLLLWCTGLTSIGQSGFCSKLHWSWTVRHVTILVSWNITCFMHHVTIFWFDKIYHMFDTDLVETNCNLTFFHTSLRDFSLFLGFNWLFHLTFTLSLCWWNPEFPGNTDQTRPYHRHVW